jgi:hypothetical protein
MMNIPIHRCTPFSFSKLTSGQFIFHWSSGQFFTGQFQERKICT